MIVIDDNNFEDLTYNTQFNYAFLNILWIEMKAAGNQSCFTFKKMNNIKNIYYYTGHLI